MDFFQNPSKLEFKQSEYGVKIHKGQQTLSLSDFGIHLLKRGWKIKSAVPKSSYNLPWLQQCVVGLKLITIIASISHSLL